MLNQKVAATLENTANNKMENNIELTASQFETKCKEIHLNVKHSHDYTEECACGESNALYGEGYDSYGDPINVTWVECEECNEGLVIKNGHI